MHYWPELPVVKKIIALITITNAKKPSAIIVVHLDKNASMVRPLFLDKNVSHFFNILSTYYKKFFA